MTGFMRVLWHFRLQLLHACDLLAVAHTVLQLPVSRLQFVPVPLLALLLWLTALMPARTLMQSMGCRLKVGIPQEASLKGM